MAWVLIVHGLETLSSCPSALEIDGRDARSSASGPGILVIGKPWLLLPAMQRATGGRPCLVAAVAAYITDQADSFEAGHWSERMLVSQ